MTPRVVALGGGHGLAVTLSALRALTTEITAIVTVADNGGSSGRLRQEFNQLPPGDLRMALAALCSDDAWGRGWAEIVQHRFTSSGELNGHSLGNLLLTALWDANDDLVAGLDQVGALLKVVGRVLPMAIEPMDIEATFTIDKAGDDSRAREEVVRGQVQVATAKGRLQSLRLIPEKPQIAQAALKAIADAEWITVGPGSWFSSVMPHFLLDEEARAVAESAAKKIMIFNLKEPLTAGEYAGNSPVEHLNLVRQHLPSLHIDYAIVDRATITDEGLNELSSAVSSCGGELIVADLADADVENHHDPKKLSSVFQHIFG